MQKLLSIFLFLVLTLSLTACLSSVKKESKLDIDAIDSILISTNQLNNDTLTSTKKLTQNTVPQFVSAFNSSSSIGPCKYFPKYVITVYQKDKTKRTFRTTGTTI